MTMLDSDAIGAFGTPVYVYDLDGMTSRVRLLDALFDGRFGVSYAIKANPHPAILRALVEEAAVLMRPLARQRGR